MYAVSLGISLTSCRICIIWNRISNPSMLEQAISRIHRYGQKRDCFVFHFITESNIESEYVDRMDQREKELKFLNQVIEKKPLPCAQLLSSTILTTNIWKNTGENSSNFHSNTIRFIWNLV